MSETVDNMPLVFEIGKTIETTQEAYQREAQDLAAMKNAFVMAAKCLEDYRNQMLKEMQDAKLPIKDVEYGKTYVTRCIELVTNLCLNAEKKHLRAEGAVAALKSTVAVVKDIYDREALKTKLLIAAQSVEAKQCYDTEVQKTKPLLEALEQSKILPKNKRNTVVKKR